MPAKHSRKIYVENGFYHIYNRGVEKRLIFLDEQDYATFLSYLKFYLLPKEVTITAIQKDTNLRNREKNRKLLIVSQLENFHQIITLISLVLMPNHFHLQLRQQDARTIDRFMKSLQVKYAMYFNKKYKRVGSLFQGKYKGILIDREDYFLHISSYIHRNPLEMLKNSESLEDYPYSSYPAYLGKKKIDWLDTAPILSYFKSFQDTLGVKNYQQFVEGYDFENNFQNHEIGRLLIDL